MELKKHIHELLTQRIIGDCFPLYTRTNLNIHILFIWCTEHVPGTRFSSVLYSVPYFIFELLDYQAFDFSEFILSFFMIRKILIFKLGATAWKVSKYGVFSGPCFPVFWLNTGIQEKKDQKKLRIWTLFILHIFTYFIPMFPLYIP